MKSTLVLFPLLLLLLGHLELYEVIGHNIGSDAVSDTQSTGSSSGS